MEATYKLKSKLFDAVTNRLQQVYEDSVESEKETKTTSFRLPSEDYERLGNLAGALQMSKSDLLRMIVVNALDDITREYNITFETVGLSHAEVDDFVEKLNSGKATLVDIKGDDE